MNGQAKPSPLPTPFELLAALAVGGLFWFISGSIGSLVVGLAVVLAGLVLARTLGSRSPVAGKLILVAALVALLILAPFLADSDFRTNQLGLALATALALLGLNLVTGYTGQVSLAHAAFVGLGAFTVAISVDQWQLSLGLAMLLGVGVSALAGLLIGIPALRLRGHYLAIATLAIGVAFVPIGKVSEIEDYTGGFAGLSLSQYAFAPPFEADWLTLDRWHYFLVAAALIISTVLMYNLLNSPLGRSFRAVRDREVSATSMGVNVSSTKLIAFTSSAAYAGAAGGFIFVLSNRFVAVENFQILLMIEYLVALVIGGRASLVGSLLGGFFLIYIYRSALESFSAGTEGGSDTWLLAIGFLLALAILFTSRPVVRTLRQYGSAVNDRYGELLVNLLKVVVAVGAAFAFTWFMRLATEDLFQLRFLRGAISGALLIFMVLFLPDGLAGLIDNLRNASWGRVGGWLKVNIIGSFSSGGSGGRLTPEDEKVSIAR
ncbi:MAG: hypothetical protein GEU28_04895 [Dehalococcoidia bacterium]|nr:hypothetical protein [Dehalococcoidia bacterium]